MKKPTPVILLSGMGADDRVFAGLKGKIPGLVVPAWLKPRPRESLRLYAQRFAAEIDPGVPCYIGGASFGGFVALEMIPHLQARGCFLIGSVRRADELPPLVKAHRGIAAAAVSRLPFEVAQLFAAMLLSSSRPALGPHLASLLGQLKASDAAYLRWASWAVMTWDGPYLDDDVPLHQIHGGQDRVLPVNLTAPDLVICDAGHTLSMTHPAIVTDFILDALKKPRATRPAATGVERAGRRP